MDDVKYSRLPTQVATEEDLYDNVKAPPGSWTPPDARPEVVPHSVWSSFEVQSEVRDEVTRPESAFSVDLCLALRAACFVVLANFPVLVFPIYQRFSDTFQPLLGLTGLYVVYTLWKTIGSTLAFAVRGILGTLLATVNIIVVTRAVGHRTPTTTWDLTIAWFDLVVFVWFLVWLNFEDNTRIFALSNHVWFMMMLFDPEDSSLMRVEKIFDLKNLIKLQGREVVNLIVVLAGTAMAMIAALMSCSFAQFSAEKEVLDLSYTISRSYLLVIKNFCRSDKCLSEIELLLAELHQMRERLSALGPWVAASWWESCALWWQGDRRRRLGKALEILECLLDDICRVASAVQLEDFRPSHNAMMKDLKEPLEQLARFIQDFLEANLLSQFAKTSAPRVQKEMIDEGRAMVHALAASYHTVRHPVLKGGAFLEIMSEAHVVLNLTRSATFLMREFEKEADGRAFVRRASTSLTRSKSFRTGRSGDQAVKGGEWDCGLVSAQVLFQYRHVLFAVRNTVTICACFLLGVHFFQYNVGMAQTVTMLVWEGYAGSMLKRNLGRLQGVVLGTIIPHLVYEFFSRCELWDQLCLGCVLFVYEACALYIYYSSEEYGFIGCLVAAFGASGMCAGCGHSPTKTRGLYGRIEQSTLGIAILTAVDLLLAPERASTFAIEMLVQSDRTDPGCLPLLEAGLGAALGQAPGWALTLSLRTPAEGEDPYRLREGFARDHATELDWRRTSSAKLLDAARLNSEAGQEPRHWRLPWPGKLYEEILTVTREMRADILTLHDALDAVKCFPTSSTFDEVARKLQDALEGTICLVREALQHEERAQEPEFRRKLRDIARINDQLRPSQQEIALLAKEIGEELELPDLHDWGAPSPGTVMKELREDMFSSFSVVLLMFQNITRRLLEMQRAVHHCK